MHSKLLATFIGRYETMPVESTVLSGRVAAINSAASPKALPGDLYE